MPILSFGITDYKAEKDNHQTSDKMLVSNQNEDLFDILESVLDLSDSDLSRFASQLKKTKLENIISSIEELQRRRFAVEKLKLIMNEHYKDVLETPDLQKNY
ncbi:Uncharacterised protein [Escherichia coli]|uniref:hypothetical protein n=1 Tax=Escherichia coli TaxID=562 RepID=UPI000E04117C|nr:hypothetical protein [Escherichia coli]STG73613.1 Uncharacterised protein [Escherichia coli]